jgi:exodeoxyribonuclease V alpha subunit
VERITYHSDESGLIKGVGPVTAKRIVAHFGLETLDIIENQIERLSEVKGIAKKRVAQIQKTWNDQKTSTSLESPALG